MVKPITPEVIPTSTEELAMRLEALPEQEQILLAADYLDAKEQPVIEETRRALRELAQRVA